MKKRSRIRNRVLALVLCLALVFQTVVQASASIADTLHNSLQQNQSLLQQLQGMYGGNLTQTDVEEELKNMGLLGDDGNLSVTQNIMVDGTPMTLEQVKAMIAKPGTDLSKTVSVDGTKVTLANLQIMIKIEDELKRLKETYLTSAVPFDAQREKSYASLQTQLQSTGLNMGQLLADSVTAVNSNVRIKLSFTSGYTPALQAQLVDASGASLSSGLNYDVSFTYRVLPGSFQGITDTGEKTMTIAKGSTSASISDAVFDEDDWLSDHSFGWQSWFLEAYNPQNALFYQDSTHTSQRSVTLTQTNKRSQGKQQSDGGYLWTMSASYSFSDMNEISPGLSNPVVLLSPGTDYSDLADAAKDIFGSMGNGWYQIEATLNLISMQNTATVMTAKPDLKAGTYSSPQAISNILYWNGSSYSSSDPGSRTYNVHATDDSTFYMDTTIKARTGGAVPALLAFAPVSGTSVTYNPALADQVSGYPNGVGINSESYSYSIYDNQPPTVSAVSAPSGTYQSGMQIPITVKFSEPVTGSPKLSMKDGTVLSPTEADLKGFYRSYLYTVPASPDISLMYKGVTGITDLSNNTGSYSPNSGNGDTVSGVTMAIDKMLAFGGLSVTNTPDGGIFPYDGNINVTLTPNAAYSNWMDDEAGSNGGKLTSVCVMANGKPYQLQTDDNGQTYTAQIDAGNYISPSQTALSIDLYSGGTYENGTYTGGSAVFGQHTQTTIAPIVPVTDITIHEPVDHMIYTTGANAVRLTADVTPADATFKQVEWSSSDTNVATIDADTGVIAPVASGTVTFTATAHNNGVTGAVTRTSSTFTVSNDGVPAIVFPGGANTFYTKKNDSARIFWGQNLIGRSGGGTPTFTVTVYAGKFSAPADITGTPIYTGSISNQNNCTIPANVLNQVSSVDTDQNVTPGYTVEVSAPDPDNGTKTLSAVGYIIVYPQPVKATLNTLSKYSITDDVGTQNIGWKIQNLESGGGISLQILKNGTAVDTSGMNKQAEGSFSLPIQPVADGQLKDVYTVFLKAKNPTDFSWSTDSFVLSVYKHDALKMELDGSDAADGSSVTLDNEPQISSLYQSQGSAGLLNLNRSIDLKKMLSINFNQFSWGNVLDRILWKSSDSKVASVNYRQGSLYENIDKFDYSTYSPATTFMLAGNSDGTAQLTATHAATGMKQTLNVTVKTLKNKLLLFHFYPQAVTTVSYVSGSGQTRSLTSDSSGQLAVYEPDGIAGDISLKSQSEQDTYLGTISHDQLLSSEGDAGAYDLYPVNFFHLRPVTTLDLYFKGSDGNPYTGAVTYSGAVFKNDGECTKTEVKNQQVTLGSDGHFQLHFDSTQFSTDGSQSLSAADKIKFIYEVKFADDDYYPQLITADGNISPDQVVKFGDSVVSLKAVPSDADKNKPFIVSQKLDYHMLSGRMLDVTNFTGSIGPGNMYPSVDLISTEAWWGNSDPSENKNYGMEIQDEFSGALPVQKVKTLNYPFADMAFTQNVTTLDPSTLNLEIGKAKGAAVALTLPDGTLYSRIQSPFTFTNMVGAPNADDKDSGISNAFSDMKKDGNLNMDVKSATGSLTGQISGSDKTLGMLMQFMDGQSVGSNTLNLLVTATEDPLVFKGLITVSQGYGEDTSIQIGGADEDLSLPGASDILEGAKKKDDIKSQLAGETKLAASGGLEYGLSVAGYYEVEVRYAPSAGKWKMTTTGGGFDLGAMMGYSQNFNIDVEGIPLTAEFGLGAKLNLVFRAVRPTDTGMEPVQAAYVNDFFNSLQINMYVSAFGGLGFDYEIVALKIGVFGQIDLGLNNETLIRNYQTEDQKLDALSMSLYGTAGIKFVAKFLFVSYSAVLASYTYGGNLFTKDLLGTDAHDKISDWKSDQTIPLPDDPEQGFSYGTLGGSALGSLFASKMKSTSTGALPDSSSGLSTVSSSVTMEKRDYLSQAARSWGSGTMMRSLLASADSLTDIQSNTYPYANPVVTRDGKVLAYLSDGGSTDVNDTRASWATGSGDGAYTDQGVLSAGGSAGPDSSLALDGTSTFAAAAWARQQTRIDTAAGSTVSSADVSAMTNSTKIMAGIYNGSSWTTTDLTDAVGDNLTADLAPVVAASNGRAIVAWRSVSGTGSDNGSLQYADVSDRILYKTYSGGVWSDAKVLYNGSQGGVKGLQAAMLDDGTAGLAYTVDCGSDASDTSGWETFNAVVVPDGTLKTNIRLTNDGNTDENPQIAAVNFGTDAEPDQKFVLGWHTVVKSVNSETQKATTFNDILLAAVSSDGTLYTDFPDSLSSIGDSTQVANVGSFRFARGDNLKLDDLSLVWVEPSMADGTNDSGDSDAQAGHKDCLKAVKFYRDASRSVHLTGELSLAEMQDYTVIDQFDSYYEASAAQVHTVMLTSCYDPNVGQPDTVYTTDNRPVNTVSPICAMQAASGTFTNSVDVLDVKVDYSELKCGFRTAISFTVQNTGILPVDSVTVTVDGTQQTFDHLNLLPNQKQTLSYDYDVPDASVGIHDVDYLVSAAFTDHSVNSKTGTLNLNLPDTGISKVELVGDEPGERTIQATLQNLSDVPIKDSEDRKVYVAFYTDPGCNENNGDGMPNGTLVEKKQITGSDLDLLNQSALTMRFTYDVPQDGIPSGGVRLYGRIWVEEKQPDDSYDALVEYNTSNNTKNILIPNPVEANNGQQFRVSVEQDNSSGATVADLTVKNLSMEPSSNGNVVAQLLDATGKVIETKLLADSDAGLISLDGEESTQGQISFSQTGARVIARYFTADTSSDDISSITAQGINMAFDSGTHSYSVDAVNLSSTAVMAAASNPGTYVTIKDSGGENVLAQGVGAASYVLKLSPGKTQTLKISSQAAPTTDSKKEQTGQPPAESLSDSSDTYLITIHSVTKQISGGNITLAALGKNASGQMRMQVQATGLSGFLPSQWQYTSNGGTTWTPLQEWEENGSNEFLLDKGEYDAVQARVFDASGMSMTSGAISVSSQGKILQSIETPAAITGLKNGAAKTMLGLALPGSVAIRTDCGTESATVSWNVDACSYQPSSTVSQSFTVSGTVFLPSGVYNLNNVSLAVEIPVTVKGKGSSSSGGSHLSNQGKTQQHNSYVSDTTQDLSVNGTYQFRITSTDGTIPSFILGTPGVFSVQMVKGSGNDYFFKVTAVGKPGDRTGVYVNGGPRLLILTVGTQPVYAASFSDTTGVFDVQSGKKYQFKVVSNRKPTLTPGSSFFRCIEVRQVGNTWYFEFVAAGLPGKGCGFYLNGGKNPVAIANIR